MPLVLKRTKVPSLLFKFISIVFWNSMVLLILFHAFGSIVFWSYTFGSFVVWNSILLFPYFSCYCSHCIPKFHAIVSIVFWSSVLLFFCRVQLARRLKLHLRCHFLSITFNLYISIPLKYQKVSTADNPFHAEAIFAKAQDWKMFLNKPNPVMFAFFVKPSYRGVQCLNGFCHISAFCII